MKNKSQYVIRIKGQLIPVSEEVYLAYYRAARHERHLQDKDTRHGVVHFSELDTDEMNGEDTIPDLNAELTEDIVVHDDLLEQLSECLNLLTEDERKLVDALFFSNDGKGMTEREYADLLGLSKTAIHARKVAVLAKLKKYLGN